MTYEQLTSKFCPLIRDTCRGEGCAAYHGNAEKGHCVLFNQEVRVPDPVAVDPPPAD